MPLYSVLFHLSLTTIGLLTRVFKNGLGFMGLNWGLVWTEPRQWACSLPGGRVIRTDDIVLVLLLDGASVVLVFCLAML